MSDLKKDEYRVFVENLVKSGKAERISNGQREHASILIETMFRHANKTMRLYSGSLEDRVYGTASMKEAVGKFLQKPGTELKIILEKPLLETDQQFIKNLSSVDGSQNSVIIHEATGVYATEKAKHFTVMDDKGFRFSLEHGENVCKAVASFNEPETVKVLVETFENVFNSSSNPVFMRK